MKNKQSTEKRSIIQTGIASIPLGFICGGPVGALAVAGITAAAASVEENKDQELRKKEWERKHPVLPTLEEQKDKDDKFKQTIQIIMDCMDSAEIFPYKQYVFKRINQSEKIPLFLRGDRTLPMKLCILEDNDFLFSESYKKIFNATVYSTDYYCKLIQNDSSNLNFKAYKIFAKIPHVVTMMYTIDGLNYNVCW